MMRRLTAMLCMLFLLLGTALAAQEGEYLDVHEDDWFAEAAKAMAQRNLMNGVGDGCFGPQRPVSRAMAITVLWRLEGCPQIPTVAGNFPDVDTKDPANAWYVSAAAWARNTGVASGDENGEFHGNDPVTREQLAVFFCNYAIYKDQPVAEGAMGLFKDAASISEWAWDSVQHAVGLGILQGNEEGRLNPQGIADRASLATMLLRMLTPAAG